MDLPEIKLIEDHSGPRIGLEIKSEADLTVDPKSFYIFIEN
jgi:hypothetical protein